MSENPAKDLLRSIRILDFSRVMSGPYCTALLADLGAEVIKVEAFHGDDYRHVPPFQGDESAFFLLMNRGKKSIALNLKTEQGRKITQDLSVQCDVVVENFKPGVAKRLGIDYDTFKAVNPRLVYASISGFGQYGPMTERAAYDIIVQGMSGVMMATGFEDSPPTMVGESIGDLAAGLFGSWAILAALFNREKTGEGQHLDVAMFDTLFSLLPTSLAQYLYASQLPNRTGDRHSISVPFGAYKAKDGHFMLAILNDTLFKQFLDLIGQGNLKNDPRFQTDESRSRNEPAVRAFIEAWSAQYSVEQVLEILSKEGIPGGPIWDIGQAAGSDQVKERHLISQAEHSTLGQVPLIEQPVKFSGMGRGQLSAAPLLGEHTESLLREYLGYSTEQINQLRDADVIA